MFSIRIKKNSRLSRKTCSHILVAGLALFFFINPLSAHIAHAGWVSDAFGWLGGLVGGSIVDSTFGNLLEGVAWFFFFMAGFLANAFGQLLDMAIEFSLDVKSFDLPGIKLGWEIFRDVANMTFIFILLYIATMTILQLDSFQTKKVLSKLIIAALLINFSFFLSGVVIDASNIVGGFIYNAAAPIKAGSNPPDRVQLGESLITNLKLPTIQEQDPLPTGEAGDFTNTQKAFAYFMGGITLLIAAFTFLMGAMLFVIRQVALIFILILAPIAFAASILPKTQTYFNQWLDKLINYSIVAPIYLLLVSIVIAVSNSTQLLAAISTSTGTAGAGQSINQAFLVGQSEYLFSDFAPIIINYIITIGLLIATVTVSKNIAGSIANLAVKGSSKLTGMAIAGGVGVTAMGLRGGFGSFGYAMNRLTKNVNAESRALARGAKAVGTFSTKMSTLSMDPRSTRLGKAAVKQIKSTTGVDVTNVAGDFGKARTGEERAKERAKKATDKAGKIAKEDPTPYEQEKNEAAYNKVKLAKDRLSEANEDVLEHRRSGNSDDEKTAIEAAKEAKKDIKKHEDEIKTRDNIIKRRGEQRKEEYAARLVRPDRRRFVKTRGFFADVSGKSEANRQRAAAIRKKKSSGQKILDTIKEDPEWGGTKPAEGAGES